MSDKLKVFISSKMVELRDVREIVARALEDKGVNAWIYETEAGARPEGIIETSLREVDNSDIYVGLFWERYGEVTVQEYRYARSLEKPCFIYIRDKDSQREEKLEEFLKSEVFDLRQGVTYDYFDSAVKLGERIANDIMTWLVRQYREITAKIQQNRDSQVEIIHLQAEVRRLQATSRQRLPQGTSVDYLAQQTRGWFRTLNYGFENYEIRSDDYFEWIINVPKRRGFDRILVRGIEGEAKVHHLEALRLEVDEQKADEGWLVAVRRVSQAVREAVKEKENRNLFCYTFDELLDENADFSGYLYWLENEVKQRGIDKMYVPLACTKEEFDPLMKQKIGEATYNEKNGWIEGYIDRWLDDPSKEHISILGEFGTGKTWFALHYAWIAMQRYRDAKARGLERPRLPLVIPLRDYAKAISVESLFSEFFFRKYEIPLPGYSAFEQLNRMGKLLLIFDGFDEMAAKVDRQKMINNFWELARVVVPGAKAILTCRTEHFPEAKEGRALLNAELQASVSKLTGEPPQFEVLELNYFNDKQIRQVLSLRTNSPTVELIMNNQQLLDLARRPMMTELILEALPDITAGKRIDLSRIYLYAVRHNMEKSIKEERTFTSLADKLYFLCELSWEMLSTNQMSLNYRLFPDRLKRLFGSIVEDQKDLDHWHYDMMGQTMLIRNADGDYTPAHRSLLEFFVAYKFAAELGVLAQDFVELAQTQSYLDMRALPRSYTWSSYFYREIDEKGSVKLIRPMQRFVAEHIEKLATTVGKESMTKAILDLMQNMLISDKKKVKTRLLEIIEETRYKTSREVGCVGGNIISLIVRNDPQALKHLNISRFNLSHADFSYADLTASNLRYANLQYAKFRNTTLVNADLRDADLVNAQFIDMKDLTSFAFNQDGTILASGGNIYTHLWEVVTEEQLALLRQENQQTVNRIVFDSSGKLLATMSNDQTQFWNAQDFSLVRILTRQDLALGDLRTMCFNPKQKDEITIGGQDGMVTINLSTGAKSYWHHIAQPVEALQYFSDGQHIAVGLCNSSFIILDLVKNSLSQIIQEEGKQCTDICISSDERIMALFWEQKGEDGKASGDYLIKVYSISHYSIMPFPNGEYNKAKSQLYDGLLKACEDHPQAYEDLVKEYEARIKIYKEYQQAYEDLNNAYEIQLKAYEELLHEESDEGLIDIDQSWLKTYKEHFKTYEQHFKTYEQHFKTYEQHFNILVKPFVASDEEIDIHNAWRFYSSEYAEQIKFSEEQQKILKGLLSKFHLAYYEQLDIYSKQSQNYQKLINLLKEYEEHPQAYEDLIKANEAQLKAYEELLHEELSNEAKALVERRLIFFGLWSNTKDQERFKAYEERFKAYEERFKAYEERFKAYEAHDEAYFKLYEEQSKLYEEQSKLYNVVLNKYSLFPPRISISLREMEKALEMYNKIFPSYSDRELVLSSLAFTDESGIINKDIFNNLGNRMVFLRDNKLLAVTGIGKSIEIVDTTLGCCIKKFTEHQSFSTTLSLSLDGNQLVTGALDSSIKFWDVRISLPSSELEKSLKESESDVLVLQESWPIWWHISKISVSERMVPNPDFGKCLRTIEQTLNCNRLLLTGAKGLDAIIGTKTLSEWLVERGAIL